MRRCLVIESRSSSIATCCFSAGLQRSRRSPATGQSQWPTEHLRRLSRYLAGQVSASWRGGWGGGGVNDANQIHRVYILVDYGRPSGSVLWSAPLKWYPSPPPPPPPPRTTDPANKIHWPRVILMLDQRRRRWSNIIITWGQYILFLSADAWMARAIRNPLFSYITPPHFYYLYHTPLLTYAAHVSLPSNNRTPPTTVNHLFVEAPLLFAQRLQ